MDSGELIELFYNRTYEKFVNNQILDDKNYIVPRQQLTNYVHELVNIPFTHFIDYIKLKGFDGKVEISDLTQFRNLPACEIEMCNALQWANNPGCHYVDIGRFFPKYTIARSDEAYRKYGENHIKAATQLGLTFEYYGYWYLSCLGYIYPDLSKRTRMKLLARTLTRNRLYQQMLIDVMNHDVELDMYLNMFADSVVKRCIRSVRAFFSICLEECNRENIITYTIKTPHEKKNESVTIKIPFEINSHLYTYLNEIDKREQSNESIINLIEKYRRGDLKAYEILVGNNMRFVVSIAKLYQNNGVEFDDLIQEGTIGLIKAIEHYNENLYVEFGKYAQWWIRQTITQALKTLPQIIRLPQNVLTYHGKVCNFIEKYEQQYENPPAVDEIDILDVDREWIKYVYNLPPSINDLTNLVEDLDFFENTTSAFEHYEEEEYNRYIANVLLNSLPRRERLTLKLYYGIGYIPISLEQIGKGLKLTRERVRQILYKTLKILRERMNHPEIVNDILQSSSDHGIVYPFETTAIGSYIEVPKSNVIGKVVDVKRHAGQKKIVLMMGSGKLYYYTQSGALVPKPKEKKRKISPEREAFLKEMSRPKPEVPKTETTPKISDKNGEAPIQKSMKKTTGSKTFELKTPLYKLVQRGILTEKECHHCHKKKLMTIGDVNEMIRRYNLTPYSTRFTQYTLNIWFRIVSLLEKRTEKKNTQEKYSGNQTNKHADNYENIYTKYTQAILKLRQAWVYGHVSLAKPILLLALIEGVNDGVFVKNHFVLNEWLEMRYKRLMLVYQHPFFVNYMTEIDQPFWHLETDGFWNLNYQGERFDKRRTPSKLWLQDNVTSAYFNDDLWKLLEDNLWRNKLHNFIVENKLKIK